MSVKILTVVLAALSFPLAHANAASGGLPGSGELGFSPGSDQRVASCVSYWGGADFCAVTGVTATPVYWGQCVLSGSYSVVDQIWFVNAEGGSTAYPLTYPAGYETAYPLDPIADFGSKLVSVRVVLDGGTRQEKVFVYPAEDVIYFMTLGEYLPWFDPSWPDSAWPTAVVGPLLHPLSVGIHGAQLYWTFSAATCDGIGDSFELNCMPAGESKIRGFAEGKPAGLLFTVTPTCSP